MGRKGGGHSSTPATPRSLAHAIVEGLSGHRTSPGSCAKALRHVTACAQVRSACTCLRLPLPVASCHNPCSRKQPAFLPRGLHPRSAAESSPGSPCPPDSGSPAPPVPEAALLSSAAHMNAALTPFPVLFVCLFNYCNVVSVSALQQCKPAIITH